MMDKLTNFLNRDNKSRHEIVCTGQGFTSKSGNSIEYSVLWFEVEEIRAFKNDLFTIDEVMFSFKLSNNSIVDVAEEQPGFNAFIKAVERYFPVVIGWEESVIKPAFERNETVVYTVN